MADWDDEVEDLTKAQRKFQATVMSLMGVIDTIADPKSKARAEDIIQDIGEDLDEALQIEGPNQERRLGVVNAHLKELELLFRGQGSLFSASAPRREGQPHVAALDPRNIPRVFKELRDNLDEIASLLEEIREEKAVAEERKKNTYDRMQDMGVVPPRQTGPSRPSAPRAKKTYAKAQSEILAGLKAMNWKLSGPLKIPHATSPNGNFRLWFKAQAIYSSQDRDVSNFKAARSTWAGDIRMDGAVDQFLAWAKKKG